MIADCASYSASGVNAERVVTTRAEWPYHCLLNRLTGMQIESSLVAREIRGNLWCSACTFYFFQTVSKSKLH